MKNIYITTFAIISLFVFGAAIAWNSSSPGGKTNSPGDGENCTKCHNGTAINKSGWISSNIPSTGYVPGQTYTITVTGTHSGANLFGFECTAENNTHQKVGSYIITDAVQTQFPANITTAVTHTNNGLAPSGNSKSWSFNWVAPAAGAGDITFYAAINAANGNMGTGGDQIYNSSMVVSELTNAITNTEIQQEAKLFPNPVTDEFTIDLANINVRKIQIVSISGQVIKQIANPMSNLLSIHVNDLDKGVYFVQIESDQTVINKQFVKN